ncbi:MAG: adenosine kinase [Desulfobacterales bacterium]|nr:adenosine kinase [Desulfobacterales bacterium]
MKKKLIVGIGSALIDILVHEDDDFVEKTGALKGGMTYFDSEFIEQTMNLAKNKPSVVPGGSACNTIIGAGKLGAAARFVGKLGQDDLGNIFETHLKNNNVEPVLLKSSSPTGRVLSVITPDAQRTMLTYLGASAETQPDEVTAKHFENAGIIHIEGYTIYNKDLMMAVLKAAKDTDTLVSLDLASFTIVEESKDFIDEIVNDYVDVLIANEDEARVYTGYTDETKAISTLSEKVDIAVLKVGERGSYISRAGNIIKVDPTGQGAVVDTTGAGDLWASGFLFGLVNDYSLEKCGRLGSLCGYEVCRVVGASIPDEGWERIKKEITDNK